MTFPGNWLKASALALLALPPLLLAWALAFDYQAYFWDARVYGCVVDQLAIDPRANLYQGGCGDLGAFWTWNHPPGVTRLLAWLVAVLGVDALTWGYGLAFVAAPALMLHRTGQCGGGVVAPLLLLLLFACGVFVFEAFSGNLGVIVTALAGALVWRIDRGWLAFTLFAAAAALAGALVGRIDRGWLAFTLFAAAAALLKPHYGLYLLVPLLVTRNLLTLLIPAALLSLWLALDAYFNGPHFHDWLTSVLGQTQAETHFGYMKLMTWAGGAGLPRSVQGGGYLLFCGAVCAWAWWVSRRFESAVDRGFLALACATLMIPRLKEYDCLVLVPLYFWLRHRLAGRRRFNCQAWLLVTGLGLPLVWWLVRKLMLLGEGVATVRALADTRWMLSVQGWFLTACLILVVIYAARIPLTDKTATRE